MLSISAHPSHPHTELNFSRNSLPPKSPIKCHTLWSKLTILGTHFFRKHQYNSQGFLFCRASDPLTSILTFLLSQLVLHGHYLNHSSIIFINIFYFYLCHNCLENWIDPITNLFMYMPEATCVLLKKSHPLRPSPITAWVSIQVSSHMVLACSLSESCANNLDFARSRYFTAICQKLVITNKQIYELSFLCPKLNHVKTG